MIVLEKLISKGMMPRSPFDPRVQGEKEQRSKEIKAGIEK